MPQANSFDKNFDAAGFYSAVAATVLARDLTWKKVSQDTGVSTTTLTRMSQGRKPDASSLAALSAWAGINPADFVRLAGSDESRQPEPLAQITTLLRSDRRLKPDAAKALEAMIRSAYGELARNASVRTSVSGHPRKNKRAER